ncbi:MAG: tRNA-dihydrouridine synthase [Chlamydiia bacterium]|nr:tRNA-dihydrouridine synthase [Chlamydiia bacterium]
MNYTERDSKIGRCPGSAPILSQAKPAEPIFESRSVYLKTPFQLGSAELPSNIFYAPLAGCSDLPYRKMIRKYGKKAGLYFCEMVNLNCGCPVDKVTKDGSGSGLLRNPLLIGDILSEVVAAVKIPVTVKIRIGWDEDSIVAPQVTQIAEQAGAKAITIHGRTREQGYKGAANWEHIRDCKKMAKNILVIGNGDVFDPESAKNIFDQTLCDGILLARGAMGQPWLAEDIFSYLSGDPVPERGVEDIRSVLLDHLDTILTYQNERQALLDFRRVGCWYLKRCENVKPLRVQLNKAALTQEALQLLRTFTWNEVKMAASAQIADSQE